MQPLYVVRAGTVRSAHDGQYHHVTAGDLAILYRLPIGSWVAARPGWIAREYPSGTMFLGPREDGLYEETAARLEEERVARARRAMEHHDRNGSTDEGR